MKLYHHLTQCSFLRRVNRFIAVCLVDGQETVVHVKNTGRLRELLLPGALCWAEKAGNPGRKTAYDLVCVEKDGRIINIDSQAPNRIALEWIRRGGWAAGAADIVSEYTYGDSRFDIACTAGGVPCLIEVKGVTLFDGDGLACFPDAPTARGARHLQGLTDAVRAGMKAAVCFVVMREDACGLIPNEVTDPVFSAALREAARSGVEIIAAACRVTADSAAIVRTIPVRL